MASGKKIIGDKLTEFSLRDKRNNTRERERERERGLGGLCISGPQKGL